MTNPSLTIRPSRIEDAAAVGRMASAFADYLRGLGDTTDFRFDENASVATASVPIRPSSA
jgi:hypothetical protein